MKDVDYLLLLVFAMVLLIWIERQRTSTIIVLFAKPDPMSPAAAKPQVSISKEAPKKIGFAYA
jgi:hypothetical protein